MSTASEKLPELKAKGLPRCKGADMLVAGPDGDEKVAAELMATADKYFAQFVPNTTGECLCCGCRLGGLFGSFGWGLAHGEGRCGQCGYPARALHKIEGLGTLSNFILQYHPDDLEANVA
jgi:hypothetical protein